MSERPMDRKEWTLEPETEYRFELDVGTSLAIKVGGIHYSWVGRQLDQEDPATEWKRRNLWRRDSCRKDVSIWI